MTMNTFRPIETFKDYFLDIKPYHTKILEVIEQYNFFEEIEVKFEEDPFFDVTYINDPLCKPVGYGMVWDDSCGFDAIDCCDLFDCIGGYGIIFDNSDRVANHPYTDSDASQDTLTLAGDLTRDARFQISAIPSRQTLTVLGDISDFLTDISLFLVIPVKTIPIESNTSKTISMIGNFTRNLLENKEFQIYGTLESNQIYRVKTVVYDPISNLTTVEIFDPITIDEDVTGGTIEFRSDTNNNGPKLIDSFQTDGLITTIFLNDETPMEFTNATEGNNHGSIQLKTALIPGREITIKSDSGENDGLYKVLDSYYDGVQDLTTLTIDDSINQSGDTGFVEMYGYVQESGFDGKPSCPLPKHTHIKTSMTEELTIGITVNGSPLDYDSWLSDFIDSS